MRIGPDEIARHRDGISLNQPLPRLLAAVGLFDRSAAPAPDSLTVSSQVKDFNEKIASTPAFFWMVTDGNERPTQVNAGRAWVRAQLAATAQGLVMQPLQQALQEYPQQAGPYAAIHRLLGAQRPGRAVQMWARLGRAPAHEPAIEPAPRRGVDAVLLSA